MTILMAPDSFKGTMSAHLVAQSLAAGSIDAGEQAIQLPLADGGEGTAEILRQTFDGAATAVEVRGPLGSKFTASIFVTADAELAVVEAAEASGLHLVPPEARDAERASTVGVGDLLVAAHRSGVKRIVIGVGGSATTDGGMGALQAIRAAGGLGATKVTVLCDVTTPYELASEVYAPQKGADAAAVKRLTARLHASAESMHRDPRGVPMTGAAGGLSGALWAELDAILVPGIEYVLDAVGFDDLLAQSRLVITGEGQLDAQTAHGKVVAGVIRRATAHSTPVWAAVGRCALDPAEIGNLGLVGVIEAGTPASLQRAAARIVAGRLPGQAVGQPGVRD